MKLPSWEALYRPLPYAVVGFWIARVCLSGRLPVVLIHFLTLVFYVFLAVALSWLDHWQGEDKQS